MPQTNSFRYEESVGQGDPVPTIRTIHDTLIIGFMKYAVNMSRVSDNVILSHLFLLHGVRVLAVFSPLVLHWAHTLSNPIYRQLSRHIQQHSS